VGFLRYGELEFEANDNVLATLQLVLRAALRERTSFGITVFDGQTQDVDMVLGPGIPVAIGSEGQPDLDAAQRWTAHALAGDTIKITCLDLLCDCVLRADA
jgi:hypothetical protein